MRLLAAFAALLFAAATALAADPSRIEVLSLREESGAITATVLVYGPDGRPVGDLSPAGVQGTLDGKPLILRAMESTAVSRPPLSVVLVVDVSGSMRGEPINQARQALAEFVGSLEPNDEVALMAFDTNVRLIEDFTSDKARAIQALSRLAPLGDTALYDAVIQATQKASAARTERRIVVLLTDGIATVNLNGRAGSIGAAANSGVTFVPIGLGSDLDRPYLGELAGVTGGHFLEAPSPAALRQAYADLATAIRTQYTVTFAVPPEIDRTVAAKLVITATVSGQQASVERTLQPLAGAVPPPFELSVSGLVPGSRLQTPVLLQPSIAEGLVGRVTVNFQVDGAPLYSTTDPPYSYSLDPTALAAGNHTLKVVATDERGRRGVNEIVFVAAAPARSGGSSLVLLAALAVIALVLLPGGYILVRRNSGAIDAIADRIRPWRPQSPQTATAAGASSPDWKRRPSPSSTQPGDRPLGRLIVVDEAAVKRGNPSAFREYPIGVSPLTLGTTSNCDIIVEDPDGFIAGEEARLWVQRDRLVYHKLTTLSAMATEGVTSGWQFLESGEDLRVGPYRIAFQLDVDPDASLDAGPGQPRSGQVWQSGPGALGARD